MVGSIGFPDRLASAIVDRLTRRGTTATPPDGLSVDRLASALAARLGARVASELDWPGLAASPAGPTLATDRLASAIADRLMRRSTPPVPDASADRLASAVVDRLGFPFRAFSPSTPGLRTDAIADAVARRLASVPSASPIPRRLSDLVAARIGDPSRLASQPGSGVQGTKIDRLASALADSLQADDRPRSARRLASVLSDTLAQGEAAPSVIDRLASAISDLLAAQPEADLESKTEDVADSGEDAGRASKKAK